MGRFGTLKGEAKRAECEALLIGLTDELFGSGGLRAVIKSRFAGVLSAKGQPRARMRPGFGLELELGRLLGIVVWHVHMFGARDCRHVSRRSFSLEPQEPAAPSVWLERRGPGIDAKHAAPHVSRVRVKARPMLCADVIVTGLFWSKGIQLQLT